MSSFHVDGRVSIKLEYDLAMRLGEFLLSSGTEDKQFLALGHKLMNLDEEEVNPKFAKNKDFYQEKEIIRSTGNVLKENIEYKSVDEDWQRNMQKTPIRVQPLSKYSKKIIIE